MALLTATTILVARLGVWVRMRRHERVRGFTIEPLARGRAVKRAASDEV